MNKESLGVRVVFCFLQLAIVLSIAQPYSNWAMSKEILQEEQNPGERASLGNLQVPNVDPEWLGSLQVVFEGIVVDENDRPRSGIDVKAINQLQTVPTKSDEHGRFRVSVPGSQLGTRFLAENSDRSLMGQSRITGATIERSINRVVLRKTHVIGGKVVDEKGNGIPDAEVVFGSPIALDAVLTDSNGNFLLRVPIDIQNSLQGMITAKKDRSGLDYVYFRKNLADEGSKTEPVNLVLDGFEEVRVKATHADGKPARNLPIVLGSLTKTGKDSVLGQMPHLFRQTTNDQGIATFAFLPRNCKKEIEFSVVGDSVYQTESCVFDPLLPNFDLSIPLQTKTLVQGRLISSDGSKFNDGYVFAQRNPESRETPDDFCMVSADGRYELHLIPDPNYTFGVWCKEWAARLHKNQSVERDKPLRNVDFSLIRGTRIHGKVSWEKESKDPVNSVLGLYEVLPANQGRRVGLVDGKEVWIGNEPLVRSYPDHAGLYELRVAPGDYYLRCSGASALELIAVGEEPAIRRDFRLTVFEAPRLATTRLRIVGGLDDQAAPYASVQGSPLNRIDRSFSSESDHNGELEFESRPDAKFFVHVISADKQFGGLFETEANGSEVQFDLSPTVSLTGVFVDSADGRPLANREIVCGFRKRDENRPAFTTLFSQRTRTDKNGRFKFNNLVSGVEYHLQMTIFESAPFSLKWREVGKVDALENEMTDIGERRIPVTTEFSNREIKQWFDDMGMGFNLKDVLVSLQNAASFAAATGTHPLLVIGDPQQQTCQDFVRWIALDRKHKPTTNNFRLRCVDITDDKTRRPLERLCHKYQMDLPAEGDVKLAVFELSLKKLATANLSEFMEGDSLNGDKLAAWLALYTATTLDAETLLSDGLKEAELSERNVLVFESTLQDTRVSRFNNSLTHRDIIEQDFVVVRIVPGIHKNASQVLERIRGEGEFKTPWIAVLDKNGDLIADSAIPDNYMGQYGNFATREFFFDAIRAGSKRINEKQIGTLRRILR